MAEFPVTSLFDNIRHLFPDKGKTVSIDNWVFRLHTRLISTFFLGSSFIIFIQQVFGDCISCVNTGDDVLPSEPLNRYCFIIGTYTLPHLYGHEVGTEVAHFGVGPQRGTPNDDDDKKYHIYFQWVPYVLFFQGFLTILPHVMWKVIENGTVSYYCQMKIADDIDLKSKKILKSNSKCKSEDEVISLAAQQFVKEMHDGKLYGYWYFLMEFANLIITVVNFASIGYFLNADFLHFGTTWMRYTFYPSNETYNPMDSIFPKMTKCDFNRYGPSGNIIPHDILCILTLNIVNEKVYLIIWFISIAMFFLSGAAILYRLLVIRSPKLRLFILTRKAIDYKGESVMHTIVPKMGYSDWFLLSSIAENLTCSRVSELCCQISEELKNNRQTIKHFDIECGSSDEHENLVEDTGLQAHSSMAMKKRRKNADKEDED